MPTRSDLTHHRPRLHGGLMLGTRQAIAALMGRHPDQVSRHCQPIACDAKTRLPLYDMDQAETTLTAIRRRVA